MNPEVTNFLQDLNHPLLSEIQLLRKIILTSYPELEENIKWNGPNYSHLQHDRITLKIHPPKAVQIIFHRGAKVKDQPQKPLIKDPSGKLEWKTNDRALLTFKTLQEIKNVEKNLSNIVSLWIEATKENDV